MNWQRDRMRNVRRRQLRKPRLAEEIILHWADDHHRHYGAWPIEASGAIRIARNENWSAVNMALKAGVRGLPGGSSLARLLAKRRNVRNKKALPELTVKQILKWADEFHARTSRWPTASSGPIPDATPGETWLRVQVAINHGCRGFPPGSSLAWLLAEHRGVGRYYTATSLSEATILRWADRFHQRHSKWPTVSAETIPESSGDSWRQIDAALRRGLRGLKGRSSLPRLLSERRYVRNPGGLPQLTKKQILTWADAHYKRIGKWPTENSGAIMGAVGESWAKVDAALRVGRRGFRPGGSLPRLLEAAGRKRNRISLRPLSQRKILGWADKHFRRTGRWPSAKSGPVGDALDEKWSMIENALRIGIRSLPGGSSLLRFLMHHRGVPNPQDPPRLSIRQIRIWASNHRKRTGRWPQVNSGVVREAPGTTWSAINDALRNGRRGLSGGSSLSIALKRGGA